MANRLKMSMPEYIDDHTHCDNYCNEERSLIYFFNLNTGKEIEYCPKEHLILFLKEGCVDMYWPDYKQSRHIKEGGFVLLPSGDIINIDIKNKVSIMICRFPSDNDIKLCEMFELKGNDELLNDNHDGYNEPLYTNDIIRDMIDTIDYCVSIGVRCRNYQLIKITELLYLFRFFYPKEVLVAFFKPILSRDMAFKRFVLSNWHTVNTVEELASKANYHRATFARKFQRIMGATPIQWMQEKKAELIMHELKFSSKPIKQIVEDFDFSSPAAFNTFCRKHFNDTPARIRNQE